MLLYNRTRLWSEHRPNGTVTRIAGPVPSPQRPVDTQKWNF